MYHISYIDHGNERCFYTFSVEFCLSDYFRHMRNGRGEIIGIGCT